MFKKINMIIEKIKKTTDLNLLKSIWILLTEKIFFEVPIPNIFLYDFFSKNFHERRKYLSKKDVEKLERYNCENKDLLNDKIKFNDLFSDYLCRDYFYAPKDSFENFEKFVKKHSEYIVKTNWTTQGSGIYKVKAKDIDLKDAYNKYKTEYILIEEILCQHKLLNELNPSSVNTIRVATLYHNGKVNIIAAALRIGVGKEVDNLHAGGIGCSIDIETGIVKSVGYNENNEKFIKHPITGVIIPGLEIPNWKSVIETVSEAAKLIPQFKWVGWDIAILDDSVAIIEANEYQGVDIIQLGNKGLKPDIEKILNGKL